MTRLGLTFEPGPDPGVWLMGPHEQLPLDAWLLEATQAMVDTFGIRGSDQLEKYVRDMLGLLGRRQVPIFDYRIIRWRSLQEHALAVFFGMIPASDFGEGEDFLDARAPELVEHAIVTEVATRTGLVCRKALRYWADQRDVLYVDLRYEMPVPESGVVVCLHATSNDPKEMVEAEPDLDVLVASLKVQGALHEADGDVR